MDSGSEKTKEPFAYICPESFESMTKQHVFLPYSIYTPPRTPTSNSNIEIVRCCSVFLIIFKLFSRFGSIHPMASLRKHLALRLPVSWPLLWRRRSVVLSQSNLCPRENTTTRTTCLTWATSVGCFKVRIC